MIRARREVRNGRLPTAAVIRALRGVPGGLASPRLGGRLRQVGGCVTLAGRKLLQDGALGARVAVAA